MTNEDSVECQAIVSDGRHVGAFFIIKGYRFLLWLTNQIHPSDHAATRHLRALQYHTTAFNHIIASRLSHVVELRWGAVV